MRTIPINVSTEYQSAFNRLGWVNLNFGEVSKALLAKLNPRINTETELVIISTFPDKRPLSIREIKINDRKVDASVIFTVRRIVILNRTDNKTHEYYYDSYEGWERPGYSPISGKLDYKLWFAGDKISLHVQGKGVGWTTFLAGFNNPYARGDTNRRGNNLEAFVDFLDSFFQTVANHSKPPLL